MCSKTKLRTCETYNLTSEPQLSLYQSQKSTKIAFLSLETSSRCLLISQEKKCLWSLIEKLVWIKFYSAMTVPTPRPGMATFLAFWQASVPSGNENCPVSHDQIHELPCTQCRQFSCCHHSLESMTPVRDQNCALKFGSLGERLVVVDTMMVDSSRWNLLTYFHNILISVRQGC